MKSKKTNQSASLIPKYPNSRLRVSEGILVLIFSRIIIPYWYREHNLKDVRSMAKQPYTKARQQVNKKWDQAHKEQIQYISRRSQAQGFIRNFAT
ncbi:hypothetical protein [Lentilactobacillus hilgardii]|uniref:Uncharacterized protein n=1 Tax=Lentilactobacillus hilgardii TaxID=1588 RepID=A0A6P1E9K6_LENHI|nr:hypothetical protein [Lentilactobacillus hilgardii]EEI71707.1 hypothetical protein HMPREF0496_1042 [Lentilactobacillus hilgardii ATCC 27305]QHB51413.1 hypothetical protein GQR93_03875 [Lentilactobacillus hilgardii]